jgi:hypothetical protein
VCPHVLTGSLADAYHGAPRSTADIDLVIQALRRIVETLLDEGAYAPESAALETRTTGGMSTTTNPHAGLKGGERRPLLNVLTQRSRGGISACLVRIPRTPSHHSRQAGRGIGVGQAA